MVAKGKKNNTFSCINYKPNTLCPASK